MQHNFLEKAQQMSFDLLMSFAPSCPLISKHFYMTRSSHWTLEVTKTKTKEWRKTMENKAHLVLFTKRTNQPLWIWISFHCQ